MSNEAVVIKDEVFDMCVPQEKWEPDEKHNSCINCNKPFSLFRRRHHCRFCGRIFCYECISSQLTFPAKFGYYGPQKVCDDCYLIAVVKSKCEK